MAATTFKNVVAPTTDSNLVSAITNRVIRVFGLALDCGATPTLVTFNSKGASSGVAISASFNLGAYGTLVLPQPANISTRTVWFQTASSESFTVTTGAGSTVGVQLIYDVYAPLETLSIVVPATNPFDPYSVSNVTNTMSFDATNTSLDELANVLGSLISLFKTGTTVTSTFSASNVTTTNSYDATSTSLDELADVIGSLIASLSATGSSSDVYTTSNVTTTITFDATNTSLDEIASVLGSVIATLQGAGKLS